MTTRCVWTMPVEWERAIEILKLGCGRRIITWDDLTWRYWRALEWDGRPSTELEVQPPEIFAYSLNPLEILLLGVLPEDPVRGVLFLLPDLRWAAVATETRMERVVEEDE